VRCPAPPIPPELQERVAKEKAIYKRNRNRQRRIKSPEILAKLAYEARRHEEKIRRFNNHAEYAGLAAGLSGIEVKTSPAITGENQEQHHGEEVEGQ
jgi:hypothetical protein